MSSASRAWLSRLLAAAMALALMVAYVGGAYAHAMGHQVHHARAAHAETLSDDVTTAGESVAVAYDYTYCAHGGGHDCDQPEHVPDCCDTICHCGHAILAATPVVPHPPLSGPAIEPVAASHGVDSAGLDRPPKAFRPA
jgi:hypothetical protein